MLKKVLEEIASSTGSSITSLAQQLDVSEGLLTQMMEDLARKGYLAPLVTASDTGCNGCAGCAVKKPNPCCPQITSHASKGWMLTEKGVEAAKRYQQ